MSSKENFMKRAVELALENVQQTKGGPFGSVVVKDGQIIGEGANGVTSSNDPTAHAEIIAIRQACQKLNQFSLAGCDIYTSCEPCLMCIAAMYWARLDNIYYAASQICSSHAGFDDSILPREFNLPVEKRKLPMHQLPIDGFEQPFEIWSQSNNKIHY